MSVRYFFFILICFLMFGNAVIAQEFSLDETCVASVLNQDINIANDGSFVVDTPVPAGAFRARITCDTQENEAVIVSNFVNGIPNGAIEFSEFERQDLPVNPTALIVTSDFGTITPNNTEASLQTSATLVNGSILDLSDDSNVRYTSSNPNILSVNQQGVVKGLSTGSAFITAEYLGLITTFPIESNLSNDSDNDGLPDDFEELNNINPGGVNLARLSGTTVTTSSSRFGGSAQQAIDGDPQTSWFTEFGDAANNRTSPRIEVTLPESVSVSQLRILGNRSNPVGFDFIEGVFQAFDADGTELFSSDRVTLPEPTRDFAIGINQANVEKVRFTSTMDEGRSPGLAEFEILSAPGGQALDPSNSDDAVLDFDLDGLTNLEEFLAGTNIFSADSDGDFVGDAQEISQGTNPILADSDGDGILDGEERNPFDDSDGDGTINVLDADSDNDGLEDGVEVQIGTDPFNSDSNGNGIPDGSEDSDNDNLPNGEEVLENTDPNNPDTDGDDLSDGEEVIAAVDGFITDPLRPDTDQDGMFDGYESFFGLNPTDASDSELDPDEDQITSLLESETLFGSDPNNNDITAPMVAETTPLAEATDVLVNSAIIVRFAEQLADIASARPLTLERLTEDNQEFFGGLFLDDVLVESFAEKTVLSNDGMSISFMPSENLEPLTTYTVRIRNYPDLAYNPMSETVEFTFTTGEFVDDVAPEFLSSSVDSGEAIATNAAVYLQFSERMDPATFNEMTFSVTDSSTGQTVPGQIQLDANGAEAAFIPDRSFAVGRSFSIFVSSDLTDAFGNALSRNVFLSFSTSLRPDTDAPVIIGTSPVPEITAPINSLIMARFSEPIDRSSLDGGIIAPESNIALSNGNTLLTITSVTALAENADIPVEIGEGFRDVAGNALANPVKFLFQTSDAPDLVRPTVVSFAPLSG